MSELSRTEDILQDIIDESEVSDVPLSRIEAILKALANGETYSGEPQSRIEELLLQLDGIGGGIDLDSFVKGLAPVGEASLPTATTLYGYTFYNNSAITSINAPLVTRIGAYEFYNCTEVTDIYMPELVRIAKTGTADASIRTTECYAFEYAGKCVFSNGQDEDERILNKIVFPKLQYCGKGTFSHINTGIVYSALAPVVVLPAIKQLGDSAFQYSTLKTVDIGPGLETSLAGNCFANGIYGDVILRSETLVPAASRYAVQDIRTLYAPSAILDQYATASNWVNNASLRTLKAIEGSYYETHYADGTPIST